MASLLILVVLFGLMYAAMIRPQQKRARQHQALINAVEVGDEVMTTAGIFGTVTSIEGDVISVEIAPGTVMRVARAAIGRRLTQELEEFEAGETFDDVDDELGASIADESPSVTNGDGTSTAPPPVMPGTDPTPPPVSEAPPAAPPAPPTTPPSPPSTPPAGDAG